MSRFSKGRSAWVLWALAAGAIAWPVDGFIDLEEGKEKFERPPAMSWFSVESPAIATAEMFDSGELLLSGKRAGRTLLYTFVDGKLVIWRIRVRPPGESVRPLLSEPALIGAKKACPSLSVHPDPSPALEATVQTDACRAALVELLKTDRFTADQTQLTFEAEVLQAQLKEIDQVVAKIAPKVNLSYIGPTLLLRTTFSEPEIEHRVLQAIFQHSAGRASVEVESGTP